MASVDMSVSNDYSNKILQSTKTIVNKIVEGLEYDKTIECLIVKNDNWQAGEYTVQSDTAKFLAYSNSSTRYYVNDQVYVQIPKGDYSNIKYILGRVREADDGSIATTMMLPFDDFTPYKTVANNISSADGLVVNAGLDDAIKDDWGGPIILFEQTGINAKGYARIGISFDLQTFLAQWDPTSGIYMITATVLGEEYSDEDSQSYPVSYTQTLYSTEIVGNPYAFAVPSEQQMVINTERLSRINDIKVVLSQDNNFKDYNDEMIPCYDLTDPDAPILYPPNIVATNVAVQLGQDGKNQLTEYLRLSSNKLFYSNDGAADENNLVRTVEIEWQHITGAHQLEIFDSVNTGIDDDVLLELQQYMPDEDNNLVWTTIATNQFSYDVELDGDAATTKFRAHLKTGTKEMYSKTLTFINTTDESFVPAVYLDSQDLIFRCWHFEEVSNEADDPSVLQIQAVPDTLLEGGQFNIYDENNLITFNGQGKKYSDVVYCVSLFYKDENEYKSLAELSDTGSSWAFDNLSTFNGVVGSMLTNWSQLNNEQGQALSQAIFGDRASASALTAVSRTFRISDVYNNNNINNTISAQTTIDNVVYRAHKALTFSSISTEGSSYSITVECREVDAETGKVEGSATLDSMTDGRTYVLTCNVYDQYNQLIDVENAEYAWSLVNNDYFTLDLQESEAKNEYRFTIHKNEDADLAAPVFEITVKNVASYLLSIRKGYVWYLDEDKNYAYIYPSRVEFKSDGRTPYYSTLPFMALHGSEDVAPTLTFDLINTDAYVWENGIENEFWITLKDSVASYYRMWDDTEHTTHPSKALSISSYQGKYPTWNNSLADAGNIPYIEVADEEVVIAVLPIIFAQNKYSSSLINNWESGTISVQEDEGAMLGKLIAAGSKNNRNQFTGLALGNWESNSDDSMTQPGLYAFENGVQTAGILTDGTGFIGAAGHGQITFDGDNAIIRGVSSGEAETFINLNPMSTFENTEKQNFFLYSKVPSQTTDGSFIEDYKAVKNDLYVNSYLNDNDNEYFVVNPFKGVLTSGTVIAKSGYIGDLFVSKGGLGYSPNLTTHENFDIIYFGNGNNNPLSNEYIFAGGNIANDNTTVNFGIEPNGTIYAQAGKIGGWIIGNDLQSNDAADSDLHGSVQLKPSGQIVLGKNDDIVLDGPSSSAVIALNGSTQQSTLKLGDFSIVNSGSISFQDANDYTTVENANQSLTITGRSAINESLPDEMNSGLSLTLTYAALPNVNYTLPVNDSIAVANIGEIRELSANNGASVLRVGKDAGGTSIFVQADAQTNNYTTVFTPTTVSGSINSGYLTNWTITDSPYAKINRADVSSLVCSNGYKLVTKRPTRNNKGDIQFDNQGVLQETSLSDDERFYSPLATEQYVLDLIDAINIQISKVYKNKGTSGSNSSISISVGGLSSLVGGFEERVPSFVSDGDYRYFVLTNTHSVTGGGDIIFDGSGFPYAAPNHTHRLVLNGTWDACTIGVDSMANQSNRFWPAHQHQIEFTYQTISGDNSSLQQVPGSSYTRTAYQFSFSIKKNSN